MKTKLIKPNAPRPRGLRWLSAIVALALFASPSSAPAQIAVPTVEEVVAYCPDALGFGSTVVLVRLSEFSYFTDLSRFAVIPEGGGDTVRPYAGGIFSGDLRIWFLQFTDTEVPPGTHGLLFGDATPFAFQVQCETTPPTVVSVQPSFDGSVLTVTFSEPMDMFFSGLDPFNYQIDDQAAAPYVRVGPTGFNSVDLPLGYSIFPGAHALYIYFAQDLSGNPLAEIPTVVPFTFTLEPSETISAVAACNGTEIVVTYRDPVDPVTTADPFNYFLRNAAGNYALIVYVIPGPDGQTFTLQLEGGIFLQPGSVYVLDAWNIVTPSGSPYADRYFQTLSLPFETIPPEVTCGVALSSLFPVNNGLVNVGLSATSSESDLQIQVFSDEPEVAALQDATLADGILNLRARRNPGSDGRVYLIVVTSTDPCGNVGVCCSTVVVPKNGNAAALASVQAQAAAAQAQCSASGSPTTPYPILP